MKYALTLLLLAHAASAADQVPDSTHVVTFPGGTVSVETFGRSDHVVVKHADGTLIGESTCDDYTGNYDQLVGFARNLKALLSDPKSLAAMAGYPVKVHLASGKALDLPDEKAFLAHYDQVFSQAVVARILLSSPHDIFCRNGMAMIANGTIWMKTNRNGEVKFSVINQ